MTTRYGVRAELERLLERDLLGPWDRPHEELLAGTSPPERYLLGRLVPYRAPSTPPRADERDGDQLQDDGPIDDDPALVDLEGDRRRRGSRQRGGDQPGNPHRQHEHVGARPVVPPRHPTSTGSWTAGPC